MKNDFHWGLHLASSLVAPCESLFHCGKWFIVWESFYFLLHFIFSLPISDILLLFFCYAKVSRKLPVSFVSQLVLNRNILVLKWVGSENSTPSTANPEQFFKLNYILCFLKIILLSANRVWFPPIGIYKLNNFVFYSCSTIWCICTMHLRIWLDGLWEICSTLRPPWISSI